MRYVTFFTLLCLLITFQYLPAQAPNTQWFKYYILDNWETHFNCVQQTFDGGYIVAGEQYAIAPSRGLLIKTDAFGDTVWTKRLLFMSGLDYIQQTIDSGYITIGGSQGNPRLVKTTKDGDTLWTKTFDIIPYGTCCVQQTADSGYIATAGGLLIRTDENGDTLWTKRMFSSGSHNTFVQQTMDEGYILRIDSILIKIDGFGDTLWTKSYANSYNCESCIQQTEDGGYIFVGHRRVIKTDSLGDSLWSFVNDPGGHYVAGMSFVQQTKDLGYIIAGCCPACLKLDSSGAEVWRKIVVGSCYFVCVRQTTDNGYIFCSPDGALAKLGPDPLGFNIQESLVTDRYRLSQNYPNPFNPTTTICYDLPKTSEVLLKIYSILGQEVVTLVEEKQSAGQKTVVWDGCNKVGQTVGSGIYIYQIKAGHFVQSRKMMLLR